MLRPLVVRTSFFLVLGALAAACGASRGSVPTGVTEPDKWLNEQGLAALEERRWFTAREYFRRLLDTYPQSPYRPDAKLGVADSYLGDGTTEGYILAAAEYSEFLTFYPTHARADYAQYRLGLTHYEQMRKPQRDQTETRAAIAEFEAFVERYPNSSLMPEALARLREAKDRLGQAEYEVGYFYFRQRWYPGAIDRFKKLLEQDPQYTGRDAVYFHLAEALRIVKLDAEALPYYDKLVTEFEQSEYLADARKRMDEIKAQMKLAPPAAPAPTEAAATKPS